MLSRFSHVWLFVTPWTVTHQAPPSMGFSRQEYWSWHLELPFLSSKGLSDPLDRTCVSCLAGGFFTTEPSGKPIYICLVAQLFLTLCDPMDCNPPGSSVHAILQARILEWVAMPPPGDLPDPVIEPKSLMSLALADQSFTISTTWEVHNPDLYNFPF